MPEQKSASRRVTIADIASRAGVSSGAVSLALNDRRGLAADTRARILSIAKEIGWYPSSAARALQGSRAHACGLVLARPPETLAFEPYFMELIAGIESELSARSIALTIQMVSGVEAEVEVYRRWWGERRVDGVFMVDPRVDDPRIEALSRLGLPAVVLAESPGGRLLPTIWHDEAASLSEAVRYLAALGHRRIARVAGVPDFDHTETRTAAYLGTIKELGLTPILVTTDFMAETGAQVTRQLLSDPEPPTAAIYDSDILAVAGLGVAHEMGLEVPEDLSIIAWNDSPFCQVVHPPLSAITLDTPSFGVQSTKRLLELIEHGVCDDLEVRRGHLTPRGSTSRVRRGPEASGVSLQKRATPARREPKSNGAA